MIPRVLGQWIGRLTAATCEGFNDIGRAAQSLFNDNRTDVYRRVAQDAALLLLLPSAARPLATAYRAWNHFQELSHPASGPGQHSKRLSPLGNGLACYVEAATTSNPFLMSPFGSAAFERCLHEKQF